MDPSYVLHEYLEDVNAPLYFNEFASRAAAHGLQYVDDANPDPDLGRIAPDILRELDGLTDDPIRREQYADFLANRVFRSSVLCRAGQALNRRPGPADLSGLQRTLWDALATEPKHVDALVAAAGGDAGTVLTALTELEMRGLVKQEPGMRFALF